MASGVILGAAHCRMRGKMNKTRTRGCPQAVLDLMAEKSTILTKAQSLVEIGMNETAQPLWLMAAMLEERLAPRLDALGRKREAAVHRISAASCYQKANEFSRAANLYQAALAGPLRQPAPC